MVPWHFIVWTTSLSVTLTGNVLSTRMHAVGVDEGTSIDKSSHQLHLLLDLHVLLIIHVLTN